ncbi:hypothetical protein [Candidatus Tisiphia endosymbiont of Beris chalybata]|uniref:hypothetical protein n=1 Tax=Candidatus Tisiphia endosymbiont of Beris chalybata TaxID=3066262 RepID=UPI00312CB10D
MSLGKLVKQFGGLIVVGATHISINFAYTVVGNKSNSQEYDSAPTPGYERNPQDSEVAKIALGVGTGAGAVIGFACGIAAAYIGYLCRWKILKQVGKLCGIDADPEEPAQQRDLDLLPLTPQERDWEQVAPQRPYGAPPSYNECLLRVEAHSDTEEDWDAVEEHSSSLHDRDVEAHSDTEEDWDAVEEHSSSLYDSYVEARSVAEEYRDALVGEHSSSLHDSDIV